MNNQRRARARIYKQYNHRAVGEEEEKKDRSRSRPAARRIAQVADWALAYIRRRVSRRMLYQYYPTREMNAAAATKHMCAIFFPFFFAGALGCITLASLVLEPTDPYCARARAKKSKSRLAGRVYARAANLSCGCH